MNNNCRVCGLLLDTAPWGDDETTPTYEICPCCGVEFGNEDYTIESSWDFLKQWLSTGANWFDKSERPPDWSLQSQLAQIPKKYL
jgi:hypothetical protein